MFNWIREYKIKKAMDRLFYEDGKAEIIGSSPTMTGKGKKQLKPEAKIFLEFMRDVCSGKGELMKEGSPFLYGPDGRYDAGASGFYVGRRHPYDVLVKYLALDEVMMFNLMALSDKSVEQQMIDDLTEI